MGREPGDAASDSGNGEFPLLCLQPWGAPEQQGLLMVLAVSHKAGHPGEQLGMQESLSSALDFIFCVSARPINQLIRVA